MPYISTFAYCQTNENWWYRSIFFISHFGVAFQEVQNAGFLVIPGPPVQMAPLKSGQIAKSLGYIIGRDYGSRNFRFYFFKTKKEIFSRNAKTNSKRNFT